MRVKGAFFKRALGIFLALLLLVPNTAVFSVFGYEDDVEIIEMGRVHYTHAPKTFTFTVPQGAQKVEVGIYGRSPDQVNMFDGWNAWLQVNGEEVWRFKGTFEPYGAIFHDYIRGADLFFENGKNNWYDISSKVKPGQNTLTYYHYTAGDGFGLRVRITGGQRKTERTEIMDLGIIHYRNAPGSITITKPPELVKMEVGIYGSSSKMISQYGGWRGHLSINGRTIWKHSHQDSQLGGMFYNAVLGEYLPEKDYKNSWLDVTEQIVDGQNTISYDHFTGGPGIGVKVRMTYLAEPYDIEITGSTQQLYQTVITGRLTQEGKPVAGVQLGVEDPVQAVSTQTPITDSDGYFTYTTSPSYQVSDIIVFNFFYKGSQAPFLMKNAFKEYEVYEVPMAENDVFAALDDLSKENIYQLQNMKSGIPAGYDIGGTEIVGMEEDMYQVLKEEMIQTDYSELLEVVEWAGATALCAKGVATSKFTFGLSVIACKPLLLKLVKVGTEETIDVLKNNDYIDEETRQAFYGISDLAFGCASMEGPLDAASVLLDVADHSRRIIASDTVVNEHGQTVRVFEIADSGSDTANVILTIAEVVK